MRVTAYAAALLLGVFFGVNPTSATVWISGDPGGLIDDYTAKFAVLRQSNEQVAIDGQCSSACTMVLGAIPNRRLCVTSRASFGFHSAWHFTRDGGRAMSPSGNRVLWSHYPPRIRDWIMRHGGLRPEMLFLRGADLAAMFPACHRSQARSD
jgi:hypothetical protein